MESPKGKWSEQRVLAYFTAGTSFLILCALALNTVHNIHMSKTQKELTKHQIKDYEKKNGKLSDET